MNEHTEVSGSLEVLKLTPRSRTVFHDSDGEEMFVVDADLKQFSVYGTIVSDPNEITKAFNEWVRANILGQ